MEVQKDESEEDFFEELLVAPPKDYFFVRPNDNFKSKFDVLIICCAVFNCFTIPIKVAFEPVGMSSLAFTLFNNLIDLTFLMDICVNFRTVILDDSGEEVTDLWLIAKNYIGGVFLIDLIATVPID